MYSPAKIVPDVVSFGVSVIFSDGVFMMGLLIVNEVFNFCKCFDVALIEVWSCFFCCLDWRFGEGFPEFGFVVLDVGDWFLFAAG